MDRSTDLKLGEYYILQNVSLNLIAYIYLVVKFLFCLCFRFFHVYLLPVMVNKDVYYPNAECSMFKVIISNKPKIEM